MKRWSLLILTIVSLVPLVLLVYGYAHQGQFFASQEHIRHMLLPFGIWAAVLFVGLQILQVVITPINHYSIGLAGGFIFGPLYGSLLNVIGRIIGHTAAFAISRYAARPLLKKGLSDETIANYDRWIGGSGFILFLAYWLPFFPDDELSYIAGASKMSWKKFMTANVFGQFGGSIGLAYAGAGVVHDPRAYIILGISLIGGCASFWFIKKTH